MRIDISDERLNRYEVVARKGARVMTVTGGDMLAIVARLRRAEEARHEEAMATSDGDRLAALLDHAMFHARLTPKQREVTRLLLKGLATTEISPVTGNTTKTLKHHISAIFQKFGVGSRAELFHTIFPT